jgi:uncharacterized protein (UPF0335 family)
MSEGITTITVNLDKPCAECGKGGAVDNCLCLACTALAVAGRTMKSDEGKAVKARAHNLRPHEKEPPVSKAAFAKDMLKSFINRVERLNEERDALSADIREVFAEAKGSGFDTKIMRQVIRMRKLDKADFQEQEAMLDLYLTAMDMR